MKRTFSPSFADLGPRLLLVMLDEDCVAGLSAFALFLSLLSLVLSAALLGVPLIYDRYVFSCPLSVCSASDFQRYACTSLSLASSDMHPIPSSSQRCLQKRLPQRTGPLPQSPPLRIRPFHNRPPLNLYPLPLHHHLSLFPTRVQRPSPRPVRDDLPLRGRSRRFRRRPPLLVPYQKGRSNLCVAVDGGVGGVLGLGGPGLEEKQGQGRRGCWGDQAET
jgi:hypothetical protein